jgi:eukaryotic-like serine/threonine-protein kinase
MSGASADLAEQSARWIGRLIASRYRLLRVVGVGGHGAVYEARHELTGRRFAVKLLLRDARELRGIAERLVREAKATSRVTHPNVLEVIDVGVDPESDRLYLIEEFLEGDDLRARMRARRRMSTQEVRAVIGPVLDGLGAAHAQGVVHRDLKPGNVMLSPGADGSEVPKIIDFGISKVEGAEAQDDDGEPLTRDGMLLGTPDYMAPEQARGAQSVDARADLWSIGVMMYEMLAGVRPFRGAGPAAVIVAVAMEEPTSIAAHRPDLPEPWVALVHACLAKPLDARVASARALREALDRAGDQDPAVVLGALPEPITGPVDTLASAPAGPIAAPIAHGLDAMLSGEQVFSEAPPAPVAPPPAPPRGASWRWVVVALGAFTMVGALAWTRLKPGAPLAPPRAAVRWRPPPLPDASATRAPPTVNVVRPRPGGDDAPLPQRLSATAQRTVMVAFTPRVRACVGPAFFGQFPVTLTARGDGSVRAVRVGAAVRGSEAGRCVVTALRRVTVPRFAAREMEIGWVYVFAAQSQ